MIKDIPGYEGLYQVSDSGYIYSLISNKILKENTNNRGYKYVILNDKKTIYIHRIVAEVFLPNEYNLSCINHKDENKNNNSVNNLEWCTYSYNNNYGTRNKRVSNKMKKPVYCANNKTHYDSVRAAAAALGFREDAISQVARGDRASLFGYKFKYTEVTHAEFHRRTKK